MRILLLLLLFSPTLTLAQPSDAQRAAAAYLDSIRDRPAALRAFFQDMPKGGDLHHHFEGSIYAETLLEAAISEGYWLDTLRLDIRPQRPATDTAGWLALPALAAKPGFTRLRRRLLQRWSILDYTFDPNDTPDQHFFGAFPAFLPAIPAATDEGLLRLKARAIAEQVQYLETIFLPFACPQASFRYPEAMDGELRSLQASRDSETLFRLFDKLYEELETGGLEACAQEHTAWIERKHDSLQLDTDRFLLRYQNYVLRVLPPTRVFADLAVNFMSASLSPLIVSVNIVAPEHHPVALRDYWLHMQMYRYLSGRFPRVQKALHAGELAPGMVTPEDLSDHVRQAVVIAGADRIGHGVSLPFERGRQDLLERMAGAGVAVEVNLSSSHYILQLPYRQHPLLLFHEQQVPVVISTDDAGVLRTSLSEQYVLLARWFPELSYHDIRAIVRNSIQYSFIEPPHKKDDILDELEGRLRDFEEAIQRKVAP